MFFTSILLYSTRHACTVLYDISCKNTSGEPHVLHRASQRMSSIGELTQVFEME